MISIPFNLIGVSGPTVSGKTALGVALLEHPDSEIVWLPGESVQVGLALQQIDSTGIFQL